MKFLPYFHELAYKILTSLPEGIRIHDMPIHLMDREYHDCRRELFDLADPQKLKYVEPERDYFGRRTRYYGARREHFIYTVDIGSKYIHFRIYVEQEYISFIQRKGMERW
jgi:hypothetical protein